MDKNNAYSYSDDYRVILERARAHAASQGASMLMQSHLWQAVLDLHLPMVEAILGRPNLIRPHYDEIDIAKASAAKEKLCFSSEVDRVLSLFGGYLDRITANLAKPVRIDAMHVCAALLLKPRDGVQNFLDLNGFNSRGKTWSKRILDFMSAYDDKIIREGNEVLLSTRLKLLRDIRRDIEGVCFGQNQAIRQAISQIATFWGQTPRERQGRPCSFCFVGATGTGKTLLAETLREKLAAKTGTAVVRTLDCSRYAAHQLALDLIGRDTSWKDNGTPGHLTRMATEEPEAVLILENFDKAHPEAIAHILTMLAEGKIKDGFSGEDVSFARNIVILTTSLGAEEFLGSKKFIKLAEANGGTIPREKLIEGLTTTLENENPERAGILSEVLQKVDVPVLFRKHDVASTLRIINRAIETAAQNLENVFHAKIELDNNRFTRFILETIQRIGSAHGIVPFTEEILRTELQNVFMDSDVDPGQLIRINFTVDNLPVLDATTSIDTDDDIATVERRTAARLAAAKRLDFNVHARIDGDVCNIHVGDLKYTVMPSIEDADWFTVQPPNVSWDDLVGMEKPRRQIDRIITYLDDPASGGIRPECGILLYGPPGTGKTSVARAVASTLHAPFIYVCGADFQANSNDTRAIGRIKNVFNVARKYKRTVLFIDEIDAIGNRDSATGSQAAVINALLSELDGLDENNVIVIGATNRPELLDPALTRPGRVHHRIRIGGLQNPDDREKLVDILCRKMKRVLSGRLKEFIVNTTYGWAPANIQSVLRETVHFAGGREPTREDFIRARLLDAAGDENQSSELTDDERYHIALHEAGHALVMHLYGRDWIQATVGGEGSSLGVTEGVDKRCTCPTAEHFYHSIDISLAGYAAEVLAGCPSDGSEKDFTQATETAHQLIRAGLVSGAEIARAPWAQLNESEWNRLRPRINKILEERLLHTKQILSEHRRELESAARTLAAKGIIFAEDMAALVAAPSRINRGASTKGRGE